MFSPLSIVDEGDLMINKSILPRIGDYQLLGDSIFVRLANQVLGQPPKVVSGTASLGLCVSGQKIKQLGIKIKEREYFLNDKVIVLIGTNDVLAGRKLSKMIYHFKNLLLLLQLRDVKDMIILTLPPIPKLALTRSHWEVIQNFNKFLLNCNDPLRSIRVIDILPDFISEDLSIFSLFLSISSESKKKPPSSVKRKPLPLNGSGLCTPKKSKTVPDPIATEEIGENLSAFCHYLNRMNRKEKEEEIFSSEDEIDGPQLRPYIDYPFWRSIKTSLGIVSELDIPELGQTDPVASLTTRPASSSPVPSKASDCKSPDVPDICQSVMKFTNCFIRLNYYELFFYGKRRVDMVHPNLAGLLQIKSRLDDIL